MDTGKRGVGQEVFSAAGVVIRVVDKWVDGYLFLVPSLSFWSSHHQRPSLRAWSSYNHHKTLSQMLSTGSSWVSSRCWWNSPVWVKEFASNSRWKYFKEFIRIYRVLVFLAYKDMRGIFGWSLLSAMSAYLNSRWCISTPSFVFSDPLTSMSKATKTTLGVKLCF